MSQNSKRQLQEQSPTNMVTKLSQSLSTIHSISVTTTFDRLWAVNIKRIRSEADLAQARPPAVVYVLHLMSPILKALSSNTYTKHKVTQSQYPFTPTGKNMSSCANSSVYHS